MNESQSLHVILGLSSTKTYLILHMAIQIIAVSLFESFSLRTSLSYKTMSIDMGSDDDVR